MVKYRAGTSIGKAFEVLQRVLGGGRGKKRRTSGPFEFTIPLIGYLFKPFSLSIPFGYTAKFTYDISIMGKKGYGMILEVLEDE